MFHINYFVIVYRSDMTTDCIPRICLTRTFWNASITTITIDRIALCKLPSFKFFFAISELSGSLEIDAVIYLFFQRLPRIGFDRNFKNYWFMFKVLCLTNVKCE